ncbi:osmoprotectant transport system substrate-binding protein [Actinokineospora alba]|uniref:Osmoprotectant transport system substrate-binding protein n=1 Tax=Actinokineospora alba TaxID=504798 RepID=A0A1H0UE09_9PSEU|nr:ABC transporter substrate-binding protein [Actinokineospora alba]TDP65171.1 osmoprotectant transport system substrate-binding protein [Actinokineospora alba]SDH55789.1 osmoprotectant transport system substrate-binding protein [Actinokineospora alba]SDP64300.1 osmoprotectant transport system substrate-binding protein [Actinokineospora alba]
MKRVLVGAATTLAAALTLSACGGGSDPLGNATTAAPPAPTDTIAIGSANFPESTLLAEIYASALEAKGVKVTKKLNIGSRETYYAGLQDGSIDLIPEYTGVLLLHVNKEAKETTSDDVYAALQKSLPGKLTVLAKSAAENKDAVVVTKETADKLGVKSIADLAGKGPVVFGGPPEFQKRADGIPGLQSSYGLQVSEYKSLDVGGPLTVDALKSGVVQAADLFTTDPAITANNFVVLDDPKSNFAAQNVVPLINKSKASDTIKQVLDAISAKLTTETLIELNTKLNAPDKPDASKVAKDWLASAGI